MKQTASLLCLALLVAVAASADVSDFPRAELMNAKTDDDVASLFNRFRTVFKKTYADVTAAEERLKVFSENVKYMQTENLAQSSYTLGVGPFADMSFEEFKAAYLHDLEEPESFLRGADVEPHTLVGDAPASKDWNGEGKVHKAKSQGTCGSCWAFATIAALESAVAINTGGAVPSLSEQELVDCATQNFGCGGGWPAKAFGYQEAKSTPGIASEEDYPYLCTVKNSEECLNAKCQSTVASDPDTLISGFKVVNNEKDLLDAVGNHGPAAILIQVAPAFQHYKNGVLVDHTCSSTASPNHAVVAAGYGTDADTGKDYWNVLNSWDTTFGENGFIRMERGINQCGLANTGVYPVMK